MVRVGALGALCGAASPQRQTAFPSRRTGDRIDRHHIHALTRTADWSELNDRGDSPRGVDVDWRAYRAVGITPSDPERKVEVRSGLSAVLYCRSLSSTERANETDTLTVVICG